MLTVPLFLYNEVFYRPVYNLVIFFYNLTPGPNFGLTMVALALFVRLLFIYFTIKGLKTDEVIKELEPQVKAIEANNYLPSQEKRSKIMELIKSKGVNPYTEIYTLLGQIGFLTINYQVIQHGFKPEGFHNLYSYVQHPSQINTIFLGVDMVKRSFFLSAVAAGFLFIEQVWEYSEKKSIPTAFTERWFPLLLALGTFILLYILPSAKAIFIGTSVVFSLCLKAVVKLAQRGRVPHAKVAENV